MTAYVAIFSFLEREPACAEALIEADRRLAKTFALDSVMKFKAMIDHPCDDSCHGELVLWIIKSIEHATLTQSESAVSISEKSLGTDRSPFHLMAAKRKLSDAQPSCLSSLLIII